VWTQEAITTPVLEHPKMSMPMAGLVTPSELVHVLMENFNQQLQEENSNLMVFEKFNGDSNKSFHSAEVDNGIKAWPWA
jgi:hypothetical protein